MKILLLTFTGTGNTKLCGDYIEKHFISFGHEVIHIVYKYDEPLTVNVNDFDMLGVGYPIHAFNAPEVFYKWMRSLPKVDNMPYFIYKVSGEPFPPNNASSYHFVKILKKKGYQKKYEKHFLMPYNIMFRYKDEIAKQMYLYLEALTKAYVIGIINGDAESIKYRFYQKVISFLLRIEWIAPKVNAPISSMSKKCTKCQMCLRNCPTGAIYLNKKGRMKFKASKCTMCMRCTYSCPVNAIRFGIMNPWKVNGAYRYEAIKNNKDIAPEYINHSTKGYFKLFNKYFDKQKVLLEKYHIPNPIEEYLTKNSKNSPILI